MLTPKGTDECGNEVFAYRRDDFQSSRKRRFRAHRALLEGVRARGFLRPGELPRPEPIQLDFKNGSWPEVGRRLLEEVQTLRKQSHPLEDYDHLVNTETGQKIGMKELHLAASIWPLEEVLELIPSG